MHWHRIHLPRPPNTAKEPRQPHTPETFSSFLPLPPPTPAQASASSNLLATCNYTLSQRFPFRPPRRCLGRSKQAHTWAVSIALLPSHPVETLIPSPMRGRKTRQSHARRAFMRSAGAVVET